MRNDLPQARAGAGLLLCLAAGCGGGGGAPAGPALVPAGRTSILAKFDVDVTTGKVTITAAEDPRTRAVLTGGAVSFAASDLISVGGDSGKRVVRLTVTNNTREGSLTSARLIIGNVSSTAAVSFRGASAVSTYAGSGTAGSANGIGTAAQFNGPAAVAAGSGSIVTDLFVSDRGNHTIRRIFGDGSVTLFAGTTGTSGFVDGAGTAARFNQPGQIAVDSAGNLYVADTGNHAIRRITPLGDVTTIAGTGTAGADDGTGNAATFSSPRGVAVSADGSYVFVADTGNHRIRVLRHISGPSEKAASYSVYTVSSTIAGYLDGQSGDARFNEPVALALVRHQFFTDGLLIVDRQNHAVRRMTDPTSSFGQVTTIAGNGTAGTADGVGSAARLNTPSGISFVNTSDISDTAAVVFVSESGTSHAIRALFYRPGNEPGQPGNYLVATLAGGTASFADGDGNAARFNDPLGLFAARAAGPAVTLHVADRANNRIRKIVMDTGRLLGSGGPLNAIAEPVRLVNWDGEAPEPGKTTWVRELAGLGGGFVTTSTELQFYIPRGVSGFTFTALVEANTALVNLPAAGASYISTIAGTGFAGTSNGLAKQAQFSLPVGIVAVPPAVRPRFGGQVRAFVCEYGSYRVRYIAEDGSVGTFAGGAVQGNADGVGTAAQFSRPYGIALGPDGNLYVADGDGRRVRRITPNAVVTTVAGTGASGSADGPGNTATFASPRGVTVDSGGSIFITDAGSHAIRKIEYVAGDPDLAASYRVTTIAGTAGAAGSADGTGAAARFNQPFAIAADTDGRLYVADYGNHTVRQVTRTAAGMQVTTLAGTAGVSGTADGVGAAARFNRPIGITVDPAHNLYVTDYLSHRVRRISPVGEVVTLIGSTAGFVDGPAGRLSQPFHLSMEQSGNLLIADSANHAVRTLHRLITDGSGSGV